MYLRRFRAFGDVYKRQKLICLVLGALGIANMWIAIFSDVGVMVIAVLNAIRTLYVKKL